MKQRDVPPLLYALTGGAALLWLALQLAGW